MEPGSLRQPGDLPLGRPAMYLQRSINVMCVNKVYYVATFLPGWFAFAELLVAGLTSEPFALPFSPHSEQDARSRRGRKCPRLNRHEPGITLRAKQLTLATPIVSSWALTESDAVRKCKQMLVPFLIKPQNLYVIKWMRPRISCLDKSTPSCIRG